MVSQIAHDTPWLGFAAVLVATCLLLLGGGGCDSGTTRRALFTLKGHPGAVYTVAFNPNGERLAAGAAREFTEPMSGSRENLVIWDVKAGERLHSYVIDAAYVFSVAFSPDGQQLAVATSDVEESVIVFDADADREIFRLTGLADARSVDYSYDGKRLAAGDGKGTVKIWDAATGEGLLTLPKRDTCINSVAFSPDGTLLATYATSGGGVRIWNATTGAETKQLLNPTLDFSKALNNLHNVAFSPDGKRLAACLGSNDIVKVWDLDTYEEVLSLVGQIPDDQGVSGVTVTFSSDGNWLAAGSFDHIVRIWNVTSGHEWLALRGHTSHVYGVAFSADCTRIASAGEDGTVKVWRLSD